MRNTRRVILTVLVIGILLTAMAVPVSAYTIRPAPSKDGVIVYMTGRYDAYCILSNPYEATSAVIYVASIYKIPIHRTVDQIAWEIWQHAYAYLFVPGDQGENPMNIVLI